MSNFFRPMSAHRRGTILILAAGISALVAGLALTFLIRMRSDASESLQTVRDAQARIMLVAACAYIQEASRIGYDDSNNEYHKEAYGWIDVRDGSVGPKPSNQQHQGIGKDLYGDAGYGKDDDSLFPVQTARSFPMHAVVRPPFAISPAVAPNPIDPDPAPKANGVPWLVAADPQPPQGISALPAGQQFAEWKKGDLTPRTGSEGRSWFRLLRCGEKTGGGGKPHLSRYNAATFIVTVGAGGTRGYRSQDWSTMTVAERGLFSNDQSFLEMLEADELRYWYLVEWSPAIGDVMMEALANRTVHNATVRQATNSNYSPPKFPQYAVNQPNWPSGNWSQPIKSRNFGGTISYVQRLPQEPPDW